MGGTGGRLRRAAVLLGGNEIGAEWTDADNRREQRHLKPRARGECQHVSIPPPLTRILRTHPDQFGTGRDGRIFSGIHGGELASITYRRVWEKARHTVLTPAEHRDDCIARPCRLSGPRRWPGGSTTCVMPACRRKSCKVLCRAVGQRPGQGRSVDQTDTRAASLLLPVRDITQMPAARDMALSPITDTARPVRYSRPLRRSTPAVP
jgi:hypothetical protein